MLIIRGAQLEALQRALDYRFETQVVAEVRRRFPAEARKIGDDALPRFVHEAVQAALTLSLQGPQAVRFYVYLAVAFTPELLQNQQTRWMRRFLRDAGASSETRIEQLVERMESIPEYEAFLSAAVA